MKILVSAMACNPVTGSEAHFGWAGVRALARENNVHVLLFDFNRRYISTEEQTSLPSVTWHFLGKFRGHHYNLFRARFSAWWDTEIFQSRLILSYAQELHTREKFDLVHHLTISSWRLPSPLWQIDVPFIWGPLGGGESIPHTFRSILSPAARRMESLRTIHSTVSMCRKSLAACAQNADCVLASNPETAVRLQHLRKTRPVSLISSAFFTESDITRWQNCLHHKSWNGTLNLFAGGSLEGRKGLAIAFTALATAKKAGLKFRFLICGEGPELQHLITLRDNLELTADVVFAPPLSGPAYEEALCISHVYLLPSLRENAGLTLMEAMLAGCVPVVAKLGGPGMIVRETHGFPIPAESPDQVTKEVSAILLHLDKNRSLCRSLAEKASSHIASEYSEKRYLAKVQEFLQFQSPKKPDS